MGLLRRRRRPDAGGRRVPTSGAGIIDLGGATAAGPRPDNQDRHALGPCWAVVSDGMGGHAGGARAAQLTVDAAAELLTASLPAGGRSGVGLPAARRLVGEVVDRANAAVRAARQADPAVAGMGATLTIAVAVSAGLASSEWLVANVGDSPAWLVTAAGCRQVTQDHSLAAELVRAGAITPEQAAAHPAQHVITRAIGPEQRAKPETVAVTMHRGEALVIASDGVSDVLGSRDIGRVVAAAPDAQAAASGLVRVALRAGTNDNATAVVVRHLR